MGQQLQMCYRCGIEQPLDEKHWYKKKNPRGKESPFYIPCKKCRRTMMREYMVKKKEGVEWEPSPEDVNIRRCNICYTKYMEDDAFVARQRNPRNEVPANICLQCAQDALTDPDKFKDLLDLLYRFKWEFINNIHFPIDDISIPEDLEPWHQDYLELVRRYPTIRKLYNFVKKV